MIRRFACFLLALMFVIDGCAVINKSIRCHNLSWRKEQNVIILLFDGSSHNNKGDIYSADTLKNINLGKGDCVTIIVPNGYDLGTRLPLSETGLYNVWYEKGTIFKIEENGIIVNPITVTWSKGGSGFETSVPYVSIIVDGQDIGMGNEAKVKLETLNLDKRSIVMVFDPSTLRPI